MDYVKYVIYIVVLVTLGYLYEKFKLHNNIEDTNRQYKIVSKYLLNKCSLEDKGLPIIWIHASREINSRWWESFYSRTSKCINQPYEFITIKSVIDHCGKSFNICLIDDTSFGKLMPEWHVNLEYIGEPVKTKMRELAFAQLLNTYGGFRIPASFLCLTNLYNIYSQSTSGNGVLIGETRNKSSNANQYIFSLNTEILACKRNNKIMEEYISHLKKTVSEDYTAESIFIGANSNWFSSICQTNNDISIITAKQLGIEDTNGKAVTIERLAGDTYVSLCPKAYGIYFPANEILNRTAFQWIARLSPAQILDSDTTIGKLLLVGSQ